MVENPPAGRVREAGSEVVAGFSWSELVDIGEAVIREEHRALQRKVEAAGLVGLLENIWTIVHML